MSVGILRLRRDEECYVRKLISVGYACCEARRRLYYIEMAARFIA